MEEYRLYLDSYLSALSGQHAGRASSVHHTDDTRARVVLAIAAHDAATKAPPRTPGDLTTEADRIFPQ
jgi:hypothetical protein